MPVPPIKGGATPKTNCDRRPQEILRLEVVDLIEDRKLLIAASLQKGDYNEAAIQAREFRKETNNSIEAIRLQADIESARKDYKRQLEILTELYKKQELNPDPKTLIALAQVNQLARSRKRRPRRARKPGTAYYAETIDLIAKLFDREVFLQPAREAFVHAASLIKGIDKSQPDFKDALADKLVKRIRTAISCMDQKSTQRIR